jgi:hypothetical protein
MIKIINLYISSVPYATLFAGSYGYYKGYTKNKIISNNGVEMPSYIKFGIVSGNIAYYSILGSFYPITFLYILSQYNKN